MDAERAEVYRIIMEAKEYTRRKFYEEQKRKKEVKNAETVTAGQMVQNTGV